MRSGGARSRSEEHTSELQSHRDLHSFPTRRSSDLVRAPLTASGVAATRGVIESELGWATWSNAVRWRTFSMPSVPSPVRSGAGDVLHRPGQDAELVSLR